MMGLDKMIAGMIGLSPDEMQSMVSGLIESANEAVKSLQRIEQQNTIIIANQEILIKGQEK